MDIHYNSPSLKISLTLIMLTKPFPTPFTFIQLVTLGAISASFWCISTGVPLLLHPDHFSSLLSQQIEQLLTGIVIILNFGIILIGLPYLFFKPFRYHKISNHTHTSNSPPLWAEISLFFEKEFHYFENLSIVWMSRTEKWFPFKKSLYSQNISCIYPAQRLIWFDAEGETYHLKNPNQNLLIRLKVMILSHELAHAISYSKCKKNFNPENHILEETRADLWSLMTATQNLSKLEFDEYAHILIDFRKNNLNDKEHQTNATIATLLHWNEIEFSTHRTCWENWSVNERYQWVFDFVQANPPKIKA